MESDRGPSGAPHLPWWTHWWAQASAVAILRPWRVTLTVAGIVLTPYYFVSAMTTALNGGGTVHLIGLWVTFVCWLVVTVLAFRWTLRSTKQ